MAKIVKSHPIASKIKLENSQPHINNTMTPAVLRIVKHLDDPTGLSKDDIKTDGIIKTPEYHRSGISQLREENRMLRDRLEDMKETIKNKEKIIEMLEMQMGIRFH